MDKPVTRTMVRQLTGNMTTNYELDIYSHTVGAGGGGSQHDLEEASLVVCTRANNLWVFDLSLTLGCPPLYFLTTLAITRDYGDKEKVNKPVQDMKT
jgi:hypothetical protein